MEESATELIDYLRVIWKRKILIIVVTLVGIVVGVGVEVKKSGSKSPPVATYRASVIVKIGQKVILTPANSITIPTTAYVESAEDLVESLPLRYGLKVSESSGYHLDVKQIGQLSMLELTLGGPDSGVGRVLKEIVAKLIDEHRRMTSGSVAAYTGFINNLEADVKMFQGNISIIDASIKEIKRREGIYLENMAATGKEINKEKGVGNRSAFLNMLYLKFLDKERDLSSNRANLRNTQWQLIMYQAAMDNLKGYSTKTIGGIKSTTVVPGKSKDFNSILVAGVVGLIMSFFIAFFTEYIVESTSRRKWE